MKNKLIFSAVVCTLLCVSLIFAVQAASFKDLTTDHWAYKNIMDLSSEGVINGYSDGTFRPEAQVTRAEFVKLIGTTAETIFKAEDRQAFKDTMEKIGEPMNML